MSDTELEIIIYAMQLRLNRGEDISAVLDTYTKLSAKEKSYVLSTVKS